MKSRTKLHLMSAVYCALLTGMNWFRSTQFSRKEGLISESFSPQSGALLVSGVLTVYLAYRCLKAAHSRLENGEKVGEGRWIQSWSVLLYAIPFLWQQQSTSVWQTPDGATATTTRGYGGPLSGWILLFMIAGLLLFQILSRLSGSRGGPPPTTPVA
jgi:hypothetical protein